MLAIPRDQLAATRLAPTNTGGREFALHPAMTRLASLFGSGKAAVVANVGPLVQPVTKLQWDAGNTPVPPNLFSHADQQSQWQIGTIDSAVRTGWGGRLVDLFYPQNTDRIASCISTAGRSTFLGGQTATGFSISVERPLRLRFLRVGQRDRSGECGLPRDPDDGTLAPVRAGVRRHAERLDRARSGCSTRRSTRRPAADGVSESGLGDQLSTVARMIAAHGTLGVKRQAFFVPLGGFDTHGGDQPSDQDTCWAR